jgi:hypothetical protein
MNGSRVYHIWGKKSFGDADWMPYEILVARK